MARVARSALWLTAVVVLPFQGVAIPSAPRIFHPVTSDEIESLLTLCFADVYQGVYSLARSFTGIQDAIFSCEGPLTTRSAKMGCAGAVFDILSDISEAVSYLSATASDCVSSLSDKAYCSGDISAMTASIFDVANFINDVNNSCNSVGNDGRRLSQKNLFEQLHAPKEREEMKKARSLKGMLPKIDRPRQFITEKRSFNEVLAAMEFKRTALNKTLRSLDDNQLTGDKAERRVDIAFCIFDINQGIGSLIRTAIAIDEARKVCIADKLKTKRGQRVCTVDLMGIIGSIAMATEFLGESGGHCPAPDNHAAECVGDIGELITAVTSIIAASVAMPLTCKVGEHGYDEGVAPDRRLAALSNLSSSIFV